jgi:hypothetical protein
MGLKPHIRASLLPVLLAFFLYGCAAGGGSEETTTTTHKPGFTLSTSAVRSIRLCVIAQEDTAESLGFGLSESTAKRFNRERWCDEAATSIGSEAPIGPNPARKIAVVIALANAEIGLARLESLGGGGASAPDGAGTWKQQVDAQLKRIQVSGN